MNSFEELDRPKIDAAVENLRTEGRRPVTSVEEAKDALRNGNSTLSLVVGSFADIEDRTGVIQRQLLEAGHDVSIRPWSRGNLPGVLVCDISMRHSGADTRN